MAKSIRWTLLFWYGLILCLVIAGFGATLYLQLEHATRNERDTRLREWAQVVARARIDHRVNPPRSVLPETYARSLHGMDPHAPYYIVWDPWGRPLARSRPSLDIAMPEEFKAPDPPPPPTGSARRPPPPRVGPPAPPHLARDEEGGRERDPEHAKSGRRYRGRFPWPHRDDPPKSPLARDRGPWREVIVPGMPGPTVLVGQSGEEDRRHLSEFLMTVLAASAGALAVAMLGGWFLAEWALAPIARISEAASAISASNLSQRIDVSRTENELGRLAIILNTTFERLEAAFVRQAQFTADASHELRTPLAVVISHCELALRKDRTPAEYRAMFETTLKSARRMKSVIEGLLTLARTDASALSQERQRLDLADLVADAAAMLRPLAAPARVAIDVETEPVVLMGDRDRLRELIGNLVTNAIRYNRPGGGVTIRVHREADAAVLTVADTGIGIPERDWPHLFERFYRVDPARSRELGGSGLGLAIAKWIVEAHAGTIAFASREGEGSTFTVRLPLLSSTPKQTPAAREDVDEDFAQAPHVADGPEAGRSKGFVSRAVTPLLRIVRRAFGQAEGRAAVRASRP